MNQSLLLSKLQIPPLKPGLVPRPRLLALLDDGLTKKICVLSAPAGFGKSTLLADWLHKTRLPAAWLSLDEHDNDFARFLKYLITSLQELDPAVDDTILDLLKTPQPMLHNAALTTLLNQIEGIQTESVLVLDDFHWIKNPDIHQALDFILGYLPPYLHLVISTRADPPLLLSRLRGHGDLLELRLADLRFTKEEAKQFLSNQTNLQLSQESITRLFDRTEGWVSGIQMAILSLQDKVDPDEFVHSFSGSNKYILDYLIEEVLQGQTPEVQQFLLSTSILDRLNGKLCTHVTGNSGSQEILEQLDKANLFLIPLDDSRGWYRYHHLFKDLLLHRLSIESGEKIAELNRQASQWYEEYGRNNEAINYALSAEDFDHAAELILDEAENTLLRSEINTFQNWISKLPEKYVEGDSNLIFLQAWAHMLKGVDFEEALSTITSIPEIDQKLSGRIEALMAFSRISHGDFEQAGQAAERALGKLQKTDHYFRGMAAWIYGIFTALQKDITGALTILEELSASPDLKSAPMLRVLILSQLARTHFHLGNFQLTRDLYDQALESGRDSQGILVPITGEALMGLGDFYRELNQLDQANDLILDGIELTQQWRKGAAIEGYLFLARVKQLQGNWSSANETLEKAMRVAVEYDVMDMDDRMVAMWQARLWCFEGQLERVEDWITSYDIENAKVGFARDNKNLVEKYLQTREQVILARYYSRSGLMDQALALIAQLSNVFQEYGRVDFQIEIKLLEGLTCYLKGENEPAQAALAHALELGEHGGFIGLFLECGADLQIMLQQYQEHKEDSPYLRKLLAAFPKPITFPEIGSHKLVEQISEREIEVLKYLQGNLTTPEIADEMVLSVNTVRTHIKNIYQKLAVHKRSEAVRRAIEFNLI